MRMVRDVANEALKRGHLPIRAHSRCPHFSPLDVSLFNILPLYVSEAY